MKEYKFFLDGNEIIEPTNWKDIHFELIQDDTYFGFFGVSSLENVEFIREAAYYLKQKKEATINPSATLLIQKRNSVGLYDDTYTYDVLFTDYSESLKNGKDFSVSVKLRDNNHKNKIRARESSTLKIGRYASIENETINGFDLITARILRKKIRFATTWKWTKYLQKSYPENGLTPDFYNPAWNLTGLQYSDMGLEIVNSNDNFAQSSAHSVYGSAAYEVGLSAMIFNESNVEREVTIDGKFDFKFAFCNTSGAALDTYNIYMELVEYEYNTADSYYEVTDIITSTIVQKTITASDPLITSSAPFDGGLEFFANGSNTYIEFDYTFAPSTTFTKKVGKTYGYRFNILRDDVVNFTANGVGLFGLIQDDGDNYLAAYYDDNLDEYPPTLHRGSLVYECLKSCIEQMTDTPDSFTSTFFGRTELGYSADGDGSGIFLTDGLLLRSAVDSDGNETDLNLEFLKLYKTLDSIYGLKMFKENGKIHIEKRDWTNDNIIEIDYRDISTTELTDRIYGAVKVGNNKVDIEDVNGTNEFNSILNFSIPILGNSNALELVTEYNTDYTAIEYARRQVYISSESLDTKFDDVVFLIAVEKVGSVWTTKTVDDKYDIITGVINPSTSYNLEFSPKRMMINNRDLLDSLLYNSGGEVVRFESSDDLASLVSRQIAYTTITENADFTIDTSAAKFKPFIYSLTGSEVNPSEVFINRNNLYKFNYMGDVIYGYLWQITDTDSETIIEILPKYEQ